LYRITRGAAVCPLAEETAPAVKRTASSASKSRRLPVRTSPGMPPAAPFARARGGRSETQSKHNGKTSFEELERTCRNGMLNHKLPPTLPDEDADNIIRAGCRHGCTTERRTGTLPSRTKRGHGRARGTALTASSCGWSLRELAGGYNGLKRATSSVTGSRGKVNSLILRQGAQLGPGRSPFGTLKLYGGLSERVVPGEMANNEQGEIANGRFPGSRRVRLHRICHSGTVLYKVNGTRFPRVWQAGLNT